LSDTLAIVLGMMAGHTYDGQLRSKLRVEAKQEMFTPTIFETGMIWALRTRSRGAGYGQLLRAAPAGQEAVLQASTHTAGFSEALHGLVDALVTVLQTPSERWSQDDLDAVREMVAINDELAPLIDGIMAYINSNQPSLHDQPLVSQIIEASVRWDNLAWQLEQCHDRENLRQSSNYNALLALLQRAGQLGRVPKQTITEASLDELFT
jgi:hypothetical protein